MAHEAPAGVTEPELPEDRVGGVRRTPAVMAEQPGHHDQVLAPGQRRFHSGVLAGQADHPAHVVGTGHGVDAGDSQLATVGREQRRHRPHERRLASAVRAQDGGHGTGRGPQVEPVEGDDVAEALAQTDGLDGRPAVADVIDADAADVVGWEGVHGPIIRDQPGHPLTTSGRDDHHMRADRLVATLLVLQARGRVTAAEVADELEVSVKTARRDLEALQMAGIPVYSQAGKGGGWSLLGGARTDLSGLTAAEARTLFIIAGPSSTATPEAKAALRKLVQALPETFRADAEAAASAVVLDPAHWGGTAAAHRPAHLDALEEAVVSRRQVRLGYADRRRAESERTVHPLGLVEKGTVWYLVADTDNGMRTFRVSRIRAVTITDDPVVRPPGFDLAETWQSVVETIEEIRTTARAVVRIAPGPANGLRMQFGSSFEVLGELDDGRLEVEVGAPYADRIAEQLAGWGSMVEVVGPVEVREHLARIGRELVERYVGTA